MSTWFNGLLDGFLKDPNYRRNVWLVEVSTNEMDSTLKSALSKDSA